MRGPMIVLALGALLVACNSEEPSPAPTPTPSATARTARRSGTSKSESS